MDFHRLTRRELQALCKKNKIPANMTNVAMADSLKALEIVEGLEEFLQTCESETAQSSIESPARSEVTSPYVPPTGGRSTRRRNVAKGETETAKPSTRTQRTAPRTVARYIDESQADAIETPALVRQTNRKKATIASACRKMDSQLKECVEEEKKDVLVTPAPSGVASQRRRVAKGESAVKRVYSTRRSARLAEKNMELLNKAENENTDSSKKDLFANDFQELKTSLKESTDDLDEISEITGVVDADTNAEENSGKKDEAEVISAEKQDTSTVNEVELEPIIEEEMSKHSEADGAKSELIESIDVEIEEVGFVSEIETEVDREKYDKTEALKNENEAQENDGSHDVQTSEIEIEVQKIEEQNTDKDAGYEYQAANSGESIVLEIENQNTGKDVGFDDQAANLVENAVLESEEQNIDINAGCEKQVANGGESNVLEDNFAIGEVSCDIDIHNEIEKETSNDSDLDCEDVKDFNMNEEVLEFNADVHVDLKKFKESESVIFKAEEESNDVTYESTDDSVADVCFDISLMNEEDETSKWDALLASLSGTHDAVGEKDKKNLVKHAEFELQQATEEVLPGTVLDDAAVEEPEEIEIVEHEESENAAHQMPSEASDYLNGRHDAVGKKDEMNLVKDTGLELQQATEEVLPGTVLDDVAGEEPEEIEIVQREESKNSVDQVPSEASNYLIDASSCKEAVDKQLSSIKNSPSKQMEGISAGDEKTDFPDHIITSGVDDDIGHEVPPSFAGLDSRLIVQTTCLTPIRTSASKASARKTIMAAVSDNKENIGSGSKLVLTKERVNTAKNTAENVPKLEDMSMRQLTKMLKEKLQIKNENDNEVPTRPALQALPENR